MKNIFKSKHTGLVMTVLGTVGVITTAICASHDTVKAVKIVRDELHYDPDIWCGGRPKTVDVVKAAWSCYIPTILSATATIACVFGSRYADMYQQKTLISAYLVLNQAYDRYREKTKIIVGEDTELTIRTAVLKEKRKDLKFFTVPSAETMIFYEEHCDHFFERTMLEVQDAEYQLNRKFAMDGEVCINDFLELLALDPVPYGDEFGWSMDDDYDFYNTSWIDFQHRLVELDDGMECYIIDFLRKPVRLIRP